MEAEKTYQAHWVISGRPRTALFQCTGFAKNGNAKGFYLGAGETRWVKHSVKVAHFAQWKPI